MKDTCFTLFPTLSYKYDNEENELVSSLHHHKKPCRVVTFDKDGKLLLSASKDKSVVLTDVETMTVTQTYSKAHRSCTICTLHFV